MQLLSITLFTTILFVNNKIYVGLSYLKTSSQELAILEKHSKCFKKSMTLGKGISDHHKRSWLFFVLHLLQNVNPKIASIKSSIWKYQIELKENLDEIYNNSFDIFLEEFLKCPDKFAPLNDKKNRDLITAFSYLKV